MGSKIACKLTYTIDNEQKTIYLDTVEDTNVRESSSMTTHPVANGDIVGDHMYRNQDALTINGSFSLTSSPNSSFSNTDIKLQEIESEFKRIKDEGVLCHISKISFDESSKSVRFRPHPNMALTNISWIEKINSLGYTFDFTEVMFSSVIEPIPDKDKNLPSVTVPEGSSLFNTLISWDWFDALLLNILLETNSISEVFFNKYMSEHSLYNYKVDDINASDYFLRKSFFESFRLDAKVKINSYNYRYIYSVYEGKTKESFDALIQNIHEEIDSAFTKENFEVFSIYLNDSQESLLVINNTYYNFIFEKTKVLEDRIWLDGYKLDIFNAKNERVGGIPDIKVALTSVFNCNNTNYLFEDNDGYRTYLLRVPKNETDPIFDLTNYYIVKSNLDLSNFKDMLLELIFTELSMR